MTINITELQKRIAGDDRLSMDERLFVLDCIAEAIEPKPPRRTAYLDPGNYLGRIERLWAFLSVDEGGEGVCAAPMGALVAVPLIAADEARLKSIRPLAERVATIFGKLVQLAKFTTREDIEVIEP
jgi:hypothetical protein